MSSFAFWLDRTYDRDNANTGTTSRYSNYIRMHRHHFEQMWHDDPTIEFATIAWRIASGPVMAPGFVRRHPRVISAEVQRSEWDGSLMASVALVSELPQSLRKARPAFGGHFADWSPDSFGGYEGAEERHLDHRSYLLPTVQVVAQLPASTLPRVGEAIPTGAALEETAHAAVAALVPLMNQLIDPVIASLETS